ncbi:MAG: hypothetical protein KDD43_06720 [Bdellovibrionales bacterium]|nr:hypothetical protein [Bdellovibrionales bacterium]
MMFKWKISGGIAKTLVFDAVIRENHSNKAIATRHPIERGAKPTDHVQPELPIYTVDAFVTDSPITETIPEPNSGVKGQAQPVDGGGQAILFDGLVTRVADVYQEIITLMNSATVIEIETGLRNYENCVITSVDAPRDSTSGSGLTMSIEVQQNYFVDTEEVQAPVPKEPRGKSKKNSGQKAAEEKAASAKDAQKANTQRISMLEAIGQSLGIGG